MPTGIGQKMSIYDLTHMVRSEIEKNLQEKWEDLLGVVTEDNLHFSLRDYQMKELERECHPARKLLDLWGDRGMSVSQLAKYLDHLKLERPLMLIRDPDDLQITKDVKNAVTVNQGKRLRLECTAVGFPYPRYIWFRGKTELRGGHNGVLTIEHVSLEDAGPYICRVHNVLKKFVFSSWCIVTVNKANYPVRYPTSAAPTQRTESQSPRLCIVEQPSPLSITMPIRKCINLKCRATYDPAPMYQWLKGDTWLQGQTSSELKIDKATLKDSGQYKCVVRSGVQEVVSDMVDVTVHSTQINMSENPEIIVHPVDVTTCINGVVHFQVKARGKAPLQYTWYHDGKVKPGAASEELLVRVDSVMSAGTYQCRVSSDQPDCHCMSREAKLEVNTKHVQYRATDKVALLIGISSYRGNSPPLPAVINDIYFTRKKLEELQFKVISLVNLDLGEMRKAISWFCNLLAEGAYGLFYVAGHGFQYQGQNYLVPWDAPEGIKLKECLCIQEVQTMAQKKKPAVLLVFLDICRKESTTIQKDEQVPPYQPDVAGNSCTFFSASFGQECFEPPPVKQDETVIPYLANDVMCTSIFSRYLLPVIGAKQSIPDVFKHLMDAIHTSDDYYKAYENPEMHINMIEHGRSLADPIYDDDLLAFSQRTELLNEMHQLPLTRNIELTLPDHMIPILLRYEYFFTNVLCMHVIPPLDKLDCDLQLKVKFVDGSIPVVIEPVEIHKMCEEPQRVLVVFKNLQKLACRLKPCLQLGLTVQLRKILIPELDLGWPLVSQLQQQEQEARPAPHKEATQHDENH